MQGKKGKTEIQRKENHATKVTKKPKTKLPKYVMSWAYFFKKKIAPSKNISTHCAFTKELEARRALHFDLIVSWLCTIETVLDCIEKLRI